MAVELAGHETDRLAKPPGDWAETLVDSKVEILTYSTSGKFDRRLK
jgi:hypothetical protein